MRRGWAVVLFVVACAASSVRAQEPAYVHVVHTGETLAGIAQTYYGDPKREAVLVAENGLGEPSALVEGMRLVIPVVGYHRVVRGDSWRALAERYYGDPSRAAALLKANHAKAPSSPEENTQLLVPYPLRHVARSSDSLASIAELYYGSRDEARFLRAFNGGRARTARGQVVLVPLFDLVLSRAGVERVERTLTGAVRGEPQRPQLELARELPRVREYVLTGRFVEAIVLGNQLLGQGQLTSIQDITLQRELATAYVALDREDLAVAALSRALDKQPDLELDSVRTSPRVLGALEAAKKQRQK